MFHSKRLPALAAILALAGLALATGCGDDDPAQPEEKTCHGARIGEFVPTDEAGVITAGGGEEQWCYPGNAADPFLPQLYPAAPNPCSPTTRITWSLPDATTLYLRILDENCRLVRVLIDQDYFAGQNQIIWDCRDDQGSLVPNGDYVCVLTADGSTCAGVIRVIAIL